MPEISRFFGIIIRMFMEVGAWAEIHLEELLQDWKLLQSGQPPIKIEPWR